MPGVREISRAHRVWCPFAVPSTRGARVPASGVGLGALALCLASLFGGCGGVATSAARRPASPAVLEWLEGGSTEGAIAALRALAEEGRAGPVDLVLLGASLDLAGRPTEALARLVEAVRAGVVDGGPEALLAAEAAASWLGDLEGRAGGFGETVTALGRDLEGRRATARLVSEVQELRLEAARRGGDRAGHDAAAEAMGCLRSWRAVGPFGPLPLLSFDAVAAPALPGPMPAVVDLGPGRGPAAAFEPAVRGCAVDLSAPAPGWGGTTYAVTFVELARSGTVALRVRSPASLRVFVNDALVLSRDRRRARLPSVHEVRLALPAGRSKVVVALTSRYPGPMMSVTLTGTSGEPVLSGVAGDSTEGYSLVRPGVVEARVAPERTATERYLSARLALGAGDSERARALLELEGSALAESAAGLALRARCWGGDGSVPFDVARNRGLALLERLGSVEPGFWLPYYERARHEAGEGRFDEALRAVAAGIERAEREPALRVLQASLLTSRGLWSESLESLDEAQRLAPGSCEPRSARWSLARGRERAADELEAARALGACDRTSDAFALALVRAARWQEAVVELERLRAEEGERPMLLMTLAEALRGAGAGQGEGDVLETLLALSPEDRAALSDLIDLAASGRRPGSPVAVLDAAIPAIPGDLLPERRARALLAGGELLADLRADGRQAIASYEAEAPAYDVPSVLVLDRTLFRVFPDGSVIELTHTVTRVLTAEGIELEGEFELPLGGALLAIRTIKPDGRVLEPEDIEGKDSLSLPSLEEGDYVEVEYLRSHEPPPEFPGGMWPWRFYFQGHRRAFHRSELIVLAPASMELDFSPRASPSRSEERLLGELRMTRWLARGVGTLPDEPGGPHGDESIPSMLVTSGASWPAYRDALREALADRDRPSDELAREARHIVEEAGAGTEAESIAALLRWVAAHVEEGSGVLEPVTHALAARTGERTRLLAAMARAVGVEVAVGFARSSTGDQTEDDVPSLDSYVYPVMRAASGWYHVGADARWAPACFLPPDLRGQPVLMVDGGVLFDRIPAEPCVEDRTELEARLELARNGLAHGRVVERRTGADAVAWRRLLARTPEADRVGVFEESYGADALPGADVVAFDVEGGQEPEAPLVLRYEVRDVRLGERREGGLGLVFPFRSELAAFAALPARRTPLVVHEPVDRVVRLELRLPAGASVELPPPAEVSFPLAGHSARIVLDGSGRLVLSRRLELRPGRVEPDAYRGFSAFCRRVDESEQAPVPLTLAP